MENKRRGNLKRRQRKNSLANQIFDAVMEQVESGKTNFSKIEMIRLVAGTGTLSPAERMVWHGACNLAVAKVRSYYWNEGYNGDESRAFNYVDGRYWLIPVDEKLKTNIMYESYDQKMRGLQKHQRKIAASAYGKVLELGKSERNQLIDALRQQGLLNGGSPEKELED